MLLWRELGQVDHASQCFQHALALQPQHGPAALNFARMLDAELDEPTLAEQYFIQAVQADADDNDGDIDAIVDYAGFLCRQHRLDEAQHLYVKAHALEPSNAAVAYKCAKVILVMMESPTYDINESARDTKQLEAVRRRRESMDFAFCSSFTTWSDTRRSIRRFSRKSRRAWPRCCAARRRMSLTRHAKLHRPPVRSSPRGFTMNKSSRIA
ncbi:hypothetical protein AC1031_015493 [Aphanomyces cochlioides]|nr:hypothetical protein AC1031_015493 [Aphanomyces cochlioides]